MRILQVIDALAMGGAENLVFQLSTEYKRLGHDVTVLALSKNRGKVLDKKLRAEGIVPRYVSDSANLHNPIFIYRIIPYLASYDIIHVHLFPALYWVGLANLLSYRKPLIYTEHSTYNKRRSSKILHFIDGFVYKNCYKRIVSCSEDTLKSFKKSFPGIEITNIDNGVNISTFTNASPIDRTLLGVPKDSFLLTMVASFRYPKRQDTLVKSLRYMNEKVHLILVGDGETRDNVKNLATEENLTDRVHFLGVRSDVPNILKASDVVLMSSEYEGLSLSSIEGMASGKPFIASNVKGLKEIVEGHGLLFDVNNPEGLAMIVNRLFTTPEYYNQIATQCSQRAHSFDIKEAASKYIDIYSKYIIE